MSTENHYISLCKKRIEKELNLENDSLKQRDFEYLNKVIFEKSNVDLSTATLRRIWSEDHEGIPQTKTLDAMAQVLGYEGWHEFKKSNHLKNGHSHKVLIKRLGQLSIVVLLVLGGLAISQSWSSNGKLIVTLQPEKLHHEGVPATIGFNYDISEAGDQEVKIQLSWNPFEQAVLDPTKNFYTGTYFYPDYHEAKLLSKDKILASSYVHITTQGWHGLIMKSGFDAHPIYVDQSDFMKEDRLTISRDISEAYELDQLKEIFSVFTFSNEAIGDISGDDFELRATLKDLGYPSNRICNQTDIVIKGTTNSIRIPMSNNGCYGVTALKCSETILSGKTNDLSSLSTDLLSSQNIQVKTKNNELSIIVGENEPFNVGYSQPIGHLKVIKFIFIGFGEVAEFELTASNKSFHNEMLNPF